jgi:beta-lactamase class A
MTARPPLTRKSVDIVTARRDQLLTRRRMLRLLAVAPASAVPLVLPLSPAGATAASTHQNQHPCVQVQEQLRELEHHFGARLGLYAKNLVTGRAITHRAGERLPMCSLFKPVAVAAVLAFHDRNGELLDRLIRYDEHDLVENSDVTRAHVEEGMTVRELCDAALRFSDNTAGNLLLRQIGGPTGLTHAARAFADRRTRLDRWEPDLNEALPGDRRDTTTARAIGDTYARLLLGPLLSRPDRALLRGWMTDNQTSGARFRAALPSGWTLADKTGAGDYGTLNDAGIAFSPAGEPILISALSRKDEPEAKADNQLMAEVAALTIDELTSQRHHHR